MRKLIAIVSTGLAISFAIALASAEESTSQSSQTTEQQAGTVGTTSPKSDSTMTTPSMPQTSQDRMAALEELKTTKTCTDEKGITFQRGKKGFSQCIEMKRRQMEQMGGEVPSEVRKGEMEKESSY